MTLTDAYKIMGEYYPEMIDWIDFAIWCFLGYASLMLVFAMLVSCEPRTIIVYQILNIGCLGLRFYVAIKGMMLLWTDEQRAMRTPENTDERQRNAAIKI